MIGPEVVFIAASGVAAAAGALALRSGRRAAAVTADEFAGRLALHPARGLAVGSGRVLVGEHLIGLAAAPASMVEAVITSVPSRPALDAVPACPGTVIHDAGGTSTCGGGWPDCLGADGIYVHGVSRSSTTDARGGGPHDRR
jgi:hypothetical protein